MKITLLAVLVIVAAATFAPVTEAEVARGRFVSIGTGGVTGVYYPAGAAICRLVNKGRASHGVRCSAESTKGSVANLKSIATGDLDIGVTQSDWQHHAYSGTSEFMQAGPNKSLRALFSLHAEPFTVVARVDSGIRTFADLVGKRVNIGNPGSGQRGTMEVVMAAYGWDKAEFADIFELNSSEHSEALCGNRFDAMVFTVGHPSISIKEATSSCETVLAEVSGPEIDRLLAANDHYSRAVIPGGLYRGADNEVETFALYSTVVTSAKLSEEIVYHVVRTVFENFDDFKKQHPAFKLLKKSEMISTGLSAPLHPGALRYYREVGLL